MRSSLLTSLETTSSPVTPIQWSAFIPYSNEPEPDSQLQTLDPESRYRADSHQSHWHIFAKDQAQREILFRALQSMLDTCLDGYEQAVKQEVSNLDSSFHKFMRAATGDERKLFEQLYPLHSIFADLSDLIKASFDQVFYDTFSRFGRIIRDYHGIR